ncbi:MAG: hypothetical protein V3W37_10525 [Candidatus Binatia bacterium]
MPRKPKRKKSARGGAPSTVPQVSPLKEDLRRLVVRFRELRDFADTIINSKVHQEHIDTHIRCIKALEKLTARSNGPEALRKLVGFIKAEENSILVLKGMIEDDKYTGVNFEKDGRFLHLQAAAEFYNIHPGFLSTHASKRPETPGYIKSWKYRDRVYFLKDHLKRIERTNRGRLAKLTSGIKPESQHSK